MIAPKEPHLVRSADGGEELAESGGTPMRKRKIADAPSVTLLNSLADGAWIIIGKSAYRNDLGVWSVDYLVADPSRRFNGVLPEHIVETHPGAVVYLLEAV